MDEINKILALVFTTLLVNLALSRCSTGFIKQQPQYKGIDPKVAEIVKEFKELAKIQGITFKNDVTVGFKSIDQGNVIGLTTYGPGWREIDLDVSYWNKSSEVSHMALVYHELIHAFCQRDHDYGNGEKYPSTKAARIKEAIQWAKTRGPKPGRYEDACPLSIMFPVLLDDDCIMTHYSDYITEMFNRCKPW